MSKNHRHFQDFTLSLVVTQFHVLQEKVNAWDAWRVYPDATQAFCDLSAPLTSVSDELYQLLERFVIILYD